MKEIFANAEAGYIGLAIFIALFSIMLFWVLRPGAKEHFQKFGDIPLKDE
jgi:cbb3-type cytochrome oxidase subunit 3